MRRAAVVAGVLVLAVPAAAQARTKVVGMGLGQKDARALNRLVNDPKTDFLDVNSFFPRGTTIHVGDRVRFLPRGFHTVDFPARGGAPTALFTPTGQKENQTDAAGMPFWWNGLDVLSFNPALLSANFGKRLTYSGAKAINSGLPLGPAKPLSVKFTKAGRYTYWCDVHPHMKGTVTVRPKARRISSAKADRRALRRTVAADFATARKLGKTNVPANTISLGAAGPRGVEYFQMFPKRLQVPAGTTVRFRMSKGSREVHTATFGPDSPETKGGYLNAIVQGFEGQAPTLDGRGVYPSEAPGTLASLSPALHGNGFWNSGLLDTTTATPRLVSSNAVKFGTPGRYEYWCLIHTNMHGTIVVR